MNVTPFDAYKKYVAIKLHFKSPKYDYFQFGGEVKLNKSSFEKRNDKYYFHKLCKIYDREQFEDFLVSNIIKKGDVWIGDISNEQGRQTYLNWKKTIQSLEYQFKQDLFYLKEIIDAQFLVTKFDEFFEYRPNSWTNWPLIVNMVMDGKISLETFVIMDKILNFIPRIDKIITEDVVWPEFKRKCLKYSPFIKVDLRIYKKLMKEMFL